MSRERDDGQFGAERSKPAASAKPSGAQKARFKPKAVAPGQPLELIAAISQKEYNIRDGLAG
jgi:hypothetical protein